MKKAVIVAVFAAVLAFGITACGGSSSTGAQSSQASTVSASSSSSDTSSSSAASIASDASSASVSKDFDGSGYSETGAGSFYLYGPGGGNEDGHVLQVASKKNITFMQIDVCFDYGDGAVGTVYIDGTENMKMNSGADHYRTILDLEGEALAPGIHTVEFARMDGDSLAVYKKSQYEIIV